MKFIAGFFLFFLPLVVFADSGRPNFDRGTGILTMPEASIDNLELYENVRLKLNFSTGQFTLLNATPANSLPVNTPPSSGLSKDNFCTDGYPRDACTILGDRENESSQFVLGSSCENSFPQLMKLPRASSAQELCDRLGGCGACGFSFNASRSKKSIENVEDVIYESIFELQMLE